MTNIGKPNTKLSAGVAMCLKTLRKSLLCTEADMIDYIAVAENKGAEMEGRLH